MAKYKRILLKLSGESLMGDQQFGIDFKMLKHYALQVQQLVEQKIEVAIVIGGGNIFRGMQAEKSGMDRVQGDYMGMPYFTTDSTAALRANEIDADVILKGTRVDGIYTADPEKDNTATKFDKLSFAKVISMGLSVMDMTAFTLCQENNLPIIVFDINDSNNLMRIIHGEQVGTLVEG